MSGIDNNWGLSNIENINEYDYGYLVETDGAFYFIPKECTDTTNTIVFSHGANGDAHDWEDFLKTNELDAIYAVPKNNLSYYNYDISQQMLTDDISSIQKSLGISNNNLFTIEHSAGGPSSIYYAAKNIENNPGIGPQTCIFIDPANGYDSQDPEFLGNSYYNDLIKILGDNHANIIGIENTDDINTTLKYYKNLGDAGCNVIVVKMKGFDSYDQHVAISRYSFNSGILAYLSGNKRLEDVFKENVDYIKQYDATTGGWNDVSIDDISGYADGVFGSFSNFNSVGEYQTDVNFDDFKDTIASLQGLEEITGDYDYIVSEMNDIRNLINSTSLLSNIKNVDCQSTTVVPTCVKDFLYEYVSLVIDLLEQLAKETQNMVEIGNQIAKADMEMKKNADTLLNDSIII